MTKKIYRSACIATLMLGIFGCSSTNFAYNEGWQANHTLPQNTNLQGFAAQESPVAAIAINGLKNTTYGLFYKQGIFAGRDGVGLPGYKYQRWQVPLVMGAMLNVDQDYVGQFHDFLPEISAYQSNQYGNYNQFLTMLYQINNWDTLPKAQQIAACKLTYHCFLIDDRLWWTNFFISYAEALQSKNPNDPNIQRFINSAYKVFVNGISTDRYVNTLGTNDAHSVMWYSDAKQNIYYKSTISNSLYVTAGARLAKFILLNYGDNNPNYDYDLVLNDTLKVANGYFLNYSDKVKSQGMLLDGVGTGFNNPPLGRDLPSGVTANEMFTYNQGVVLPGMAILSELTHHHKYLDYAKQLVGASYVYSQQYNGFFDDYAYASPNGWNPDGDGIAFRTAYWQYFSLFLDNYNFASDPEFSLMVTKFIDNNARQIVTRDVYLPAYTTVQTPTIAAPNHNLLTPQNGALFTYYPDGYSLPGIATALEIMVLQQRVNYTLQGLKPSASTQP
jgi:hypothetical protein